MKHIYTLLIVFVAFIFTANAQNSIPQKEADFINPANFPNVSGDAMFPSRTNYYRADGYNYTKKPDGSLYLSEGGWGASQVDSSGNLIKYINRYNHVTNGSYYKSTIMKPWVLTDTANQFQDGFFSLYSHLKLTPNNPTPNTTTSDLKTLRRATTNETFPYFNSYTPVNGDTIYNWKAWMYPAASGQRYVDPKTANDNRTMIYGGKTYTYRDYNYVTLRDSDAANDLSSNNGDRNFQLDLSANQDAPTNIFTRINNSRDKFILSIWYGYKPLAGTASKPMSDLRITGWDDTYDMKYKLWFNGIAAVMPGNITSNPEYGKIMFANSIAEGINNENQGQGADIRAFNLRFDQISESAEDILSGSSEAAMEINGIRNIAFDNDIDAYGETVKKLKLKFRMLSVGMHFDAAKIQQRVFNTAFTTSERIFNPEGSGYNAFRDTFNFRKINFFHPQHPFGLTPEHYIDIVTSRPAIAFTATDAGASPYLGSLIEMNQGQSGFISSLDINISENASSQLPFTELDASPAMAQIDASRVRVSLVTKAAYDTTNIATNNDVATMAGFSYLTQADFVALQNTIPKGEYMIKYDYSSPDSKNTIKTEGATLGEIFAKSIYRPLNVLAAPLPVRLSSFNIKAENSFSVKLEWTTSFEENVSTFEIERSNDNHNFISVGKVAAQNVHAGKSYQYTDNAPANGENFYRLKIVDLNGSVSYSDVKSFIVENADELKLYPNPARSVINVVSKEAQAFYIYDTNGKLVMRGKTNAGNTQINITHLASGVYFIKTNGETIKFVVIR